MSEPIKTPSRRALALVGAAAIAIAGAVVATGLLDRAAAHRQLVAWTNEQAVPTVQLAKLEHGGSGRELVLPGNIQAYDKAEIYARVAGYLKSWDQDIGAEVKAGQTLGTIDTPDLDQQLAQARANLATAEANQQLAAVTAQRWQSLAHSGWVSQQANDEKAGAAASTKAVVDAAQANVGQLEAMESFKTIVAPFDGVVTRRNTDVGALVNVGSGSAAGQPLFEVADLHKIRIYVQVPQAFSAAITPGMKATFDVPQYPAQQFAASVATTSHAMDPASRSMMVELQADNEAGKFAQGAYARVHFQLPSDPGTIRVPATALIPGDKGIQVALLGDSNKAVLKTVQLGRDFGDSVEVTAGLSPADRVIDTPPETLRSGDVVQLASTAVSPAAQQSGTRAAAPQSASTTN